MLDASIMFYLVTGTCYQLCICIVQMNNRCLIFKFEYHTKYLCLVLDVDLYVCFKNFCILI